MKRLIFILVASVFVLIIVGFSRMGADDAVVNTPPVNDSKPVQVETPKDNNKPDSGDKTEGSDDKTETDNTLQDEQDAKTAPPEITPAAEATPSDEAPKNRKVAYLTIDDGPSPKVTPHVLDVLKKYDIKATFFVIGQMAEQNPDILKQVDADGHLICNHTYSHRYKYIYSSPDNFMKDIRKCDEVVTGILGHGFTNNIIRFPSGSFGKQRAPIRERVLAENYQYFDWNVTTGDCEIRNLTVQNALERVKKESKGKNRLVILMHDSNAKHLTPEILSSVIEYLKSQGYSFETLDTYEIKRRK